MSRPYSLRVRLSLSIAAAVSAIWLFGMVVAGLVVRHELDEAFDSALQETAQRLLPLAVIDILDHEGEPGTRRVGPLREHEEFLTYLVRDRHGNIILHSHDADPANFPATPSAGFSTMADHRIYGESAISETLFIEVAEPLSHRHEAAMESTVTLAIPLALFVPVLIAGVWWLVGRSMQPVVQLSTEIEERGAGDLSPVDGGGLPAEVSPIADAVNHLMQRLQRSLYAERSFAANSAHELRTPIAGALAQTQRLISTLPDGDARERAGQIENALQRLSAISQKLMQLARAEGGSLRADEARDLGSVLAAVIDEFRNDNENGARIRFAETDAKMPASYMDADAFGIMIRNLVENALKHSPPGSPVEITTLADGRISIRNEGPVLAPEELARLRAAFARGATDAEGSGLGLAIAHAIADGGGARFELRSPARGHDSGVEALVVLDDTPA